MMIVKRFIRFTAKPTQNQTKYKFGFYEVLKIFG
eukprot:SAG11_NODE_6570_length_1286_cov_9.026116_1_plen_33_part_10